MKTNADVIREMNDEQLYEFIRMVENGNLDYSVTFCDLCKEGGNALGLDCDGCLWHWLLSDCKDSFGLCGSGINSEILQRVEPKEI